MSPRTDPILDCPIDQVPDGREFVGAAMRWHFSPETGSTFWLERAKTLGFDPRADVRSFEDLRRFPNVANELREVRVEDLIPRGYGPDAAVVGVYESGGTTGPPKRVVVLRDWLDRLLLRLEQDLEARGYPESGNWLSLGPTGPHIYGELVRRQAERRGGIRLAVDMDPRWVKRSIAEGRAEEAERYAEHLIDQSAHLLRTQDVRVMVITPPLLTRLARRDALVSLVNEKVSVISWGGAHMDPDTHYLLRTEVFPGVKLYGMYGSTMILGGLPERVVPPEQDVIVFDSFSPYIAFEVVDPRTGESVRIGDRGQVVMHHVSKSFLLPNNLERDLATRVAAPPGQTGDSVADVGPLPTFEDEPVIEGVY
ncbi:phenazine antibiotic biosynthesis protein [Microbispora amethystogenes]|uniref:phenazine antibiotic biosynthesis protein n=1 Tax=Microbispora amethystogenes TaxID=1427754 RepID=UPI0033EBEAA1